jgi:tetratricopeptide (TPR) repeat protein
MNREKILLFSKLGTVLFLILSVFDYAFVLRPVILTAFLWFSFDSLWRKKFFLTVFYSLTTILYLTALVFDIKNDFIMPINYFVSLGIIVDILSVYFLNFRFNILLDNGEYLKAENILNTVLDAARDTFGANHPVYAASLTNIGELYLAQGKLGFAEKYFEESLAVKKNYFGEGHVELVSLYDKLGTIQYKQHGYSSAEEYYRKSFEIRKQGFGQHNLSVAESLNNLALSLSCQHRYVEAEPLFTEAINIWEKRKKLKSLEFASCMSNLSIMYKSEGRLDEAEKFLSRALEIREKKLGLNHIDVIKSLNNLALLYYSQNKNDEADLLLDRILSLTENKEDLKPEEKLNNAKNYEELLPAMPEIESESEKDVDIATDTPALIKADSQVDYESPEIKSELDYLFSDNLTQETVCYSDSYEEDVSPNINDEKKIEPVDIF